ncbi:MAG: imidazole glycerol phosphate synthase subunit HisH, partial [Oscillospiraceae bacterium]
MIVIVDYGVGNLFSLKSSLKAIGADVQVSGDADVIRSADKIFLPGVGAFRDAKAKLEASGLDSVIKEQAAKGVYIMGICLGMQMLFEKSLEYGEYDGLGLIKGTVSPIQGVIPDGLKIPHIGWNGLKFCGEKHPVFKYINEGDCVYFVHSYYGANCEKNVIA